MTEYMYDNTKLAVVGNSLSVNTTLYPQTLTGSNNFPTYVPTLKPLKSSGLRTTHLIISSVVISVVTGIIAQFSN